MESLLRHSQNPPLANILRPVDSSPQSHTNITQYLPPACTLLFLIRLVGGGVQLGPLGTAATDWTILACPGDDGEFGGMKTVRGNRSTQRKPVPAPLCPPQIPLDQTRDPAAAVGSQRLTA
jgi:hypothetical protein